MLALLALMVILFLGLVLLETGTTETIIAANQVRSFQAFYAAEAGMEEILVKLKDEQPLPATGQLMPLGTVKPGNVQASYRIKDYQESGSSGDKKLDITVEGLAGNSRYTLAFRAGVKKDGGQYLKRALNACDTSPIASSVFNNNVTVTGDMLINHRYLPLGNHVELNGTVYRDSQVLFPRLEEGWYLPPGAGTPYLINHDVNRASDIPAGYSYYRVNGNINLSGDLIMDGVVIESAHSISLDNKVEVRGVTLVAAPNHPINLNNKVTLTDVVLVGKNIAINNDITATNVLVYDEGSTTVNNNGLFTGIIMTKGNLILNNNVDFTGSIICGTVTANNNVTVLGRDDVEVPLLPASLGDISVSLEKWGEI